MRAILVEPIRIKSEKDRFTVSKIIETKLRKEAKINGAIRRTIHTYSKDGLVFCEYDDGKRDDLDAVSLVRSYKAVLN